MFEVVSHSHTSLKNIKIIVEKLADSFPCS